MAGRQRDRQGAPAFLAPETASRMLALLLETVSILGADGTILWTSVDAASGGPLGYAGGELRGSSAFDMVHPDDALIVAEAYEQILKAPNGEPVPCRARLRAADGSYQETEGVAYNMLDDPDVNGIVLCTRNIANHMMALETNEAEMVSMLDQAADIAVLYDAAGRLLHCNRRTMHLFGWTRADIATIDDFAGHVDEADRIELHRRIGRVHAEGQSPTIVTVRDSSGNDHMITMRIGPGLDGVSSPGGVAITGNDVTVDVEREQLLRRRALHDPLTDLPNRALLLDRLDQYLLRLGRGGGMVVAVYFDLDHFKYVNDNHGHAGGDSVLADLGRRLRQIVRPDDTAGRMSGDEFVVLAPTTDESVRNELAERIRSAVKAPFDVNGTQLCITASLGVAVASSPYQSGESLLQAADEALYEAKRSGRDRIAYAPGR